MMNDERMNESEEERRLRRRRRLEEMKREKRRAELIQKRVIPGAALALLIVAVAGTGVLVKGSRREEPDGSGEQLMASVGGGPETDNSYVVITMPPEEPDGAEEGTPSSSNPDGESGEIPSSQNSGSEGGELSSAQNPDGLGGELSSTQTLGGEGTETLQPKVYEAVSTSATTGFADSVSSEYGIVIDVESGIILAQRNANASMNPASMTKVLTVLTAADALGIGGEDWADNPVLDETFAITIDITDYSFVNGCSNVGFEVGEKVTVRDLFYGTILPSGADAALGLACYVAGSHEAFVELMNQKLEEMGLSASTHFTNCVGLYDANHYSTVYDIAVILKTAADNPFLRTVLSVHTYTTGATEQHPKGLSISNWFLRRIEDKDTHGEVICGKTGYVVQSRNCAASLAADVHGKEYICVTAGAGGNWPCINDHVKLYQTWLAAQ
ncbi:MAG: D-alanyl-D-alanine carboxypeptidase [Butyrivibrio sp.]|nr:D-alanyl-D-alanine carboxypeptidase [Acetatifactor muris]MCM1558334.1 D-alanyl-D-alanine carboxypeptidase [Butyrivibrio sp.]